MFTEIVTLTLNLKSVITKQPESIEVDVGDVASFTVEADDATSYQWSYQKPGASTWTNVSTNGTASTYSLTTAERHNGYKYRCTVTNGVGSTVSQVVTLTVKTPITITIQPTDLNVAVGNTATFTVTATGAETYQWYYRTSPDGAWTAVSASSGKTEAYSLTAATRHNGYQYRCLVRNALESVYTEIVTLTVR